MLLALILLEIVKSISKLGFSTEGYSKLIFRIGNKPIFRLFFYSNPKLKILKKLLAFTEPAPTAIPFS